MSVEQVRAALECREDIPSTAAHVLLILATYTDPDGRRAFPSVATIARQAHMGERTVQRSLGALRAAGLVTIAEPSVGQLPTCYTLHLTPATPTPRQSGTPATLAPGRGATQTRTPATQARDPRHSDTQSVMDQSVKQESDAGARVREDAPPAGTSNGNGAGTPEPTPEERRIRERINAEYEQRRARRLAAEASPTAPEQGEVISAARPLAP